jgi:outer membrane protein assembly factor BamA
MRWRCLLIAVLWLCPWGSPASFAQRDTGNTASPNRRIVSGIAFFGNKTTRSEIILREMTIHVGDTLEAFDIEYCQARIYSLGLFNRVEIQEIPMDSTILLVEVDERWYLYPVPMIGIADRDWSKWYYGLGVMHQNFRGWNEKIFAGGVLGYNPWASMSYVNPWVFGRSQMSWQTDFRYQRVENKSEVSRGAGPNFSETHITCSQGLGKRYNPYLSVSSSIGFSYVEVGDKGAGRTLSPDGIDRSFSLGLSGRYDTRDLYEYPTRGVYVSAGISRHGLWQKPVDYFSYGADARFYREVASYPIVAARVFTRWTSGPAIPNYDHQYFGYGDRLRGHFFEEREGENIAGASLEVRMPIIKSLYIRFPDIPIPEFATWRFGLYAAAFIDAGTVWYNAHRVDWDHLPRGYGVGLHLLLPYGYVVRGERAWNEQGYGEWIFDIGAPF